MYRYYGSGMQALPVPEILEELGARLRRYRLQQDITQADVAARAGISTRTLRSLEQGDDVQLTTLLRVLRALGRLDALDTFLPAPRVSPMELLQNRMKQRRRASNSKSDDRR